MSAVELERWRRRRRPALWPRSCAGTCYLLRALASSGFAAVGEAGALGGRGECRVDRWAAVCGRYAACVRSCCSADLQSTF